jgi:KUP system potassium uptake protein
MQSSPGAAPAGDGESSPLSATTNVAPLPASEHAPKSGAYLYKLALTAAGVVYGDIGTSPLYAMRECFHGPHAIHVDRVTVLGVLSLIFWSLTIVVSVKYLWHVLRADNRGEGGILALMALASSSLRTRRLKSFVLVIGVFGAALLYGDGVITPAISVLSAVEGLEIAAPSLHSAVVPLTIVFLIAIFWIQKRGTARVGIVFGPIMLLWFLTLAALGLSWIVRAPAVLEAVNPLFAVRFFQEHGREGFYVLGGVMLVVTGGEALYADLGHFGRRPIQLAWFALVMPALVLNYFGQGALLLTHPEHAESPFFRMAPAGVLYPLLVLSTAATMIASQALISGVFSLTRQGTMLGLLPRIEVRHTSSEERGQIYVPTVNWLLMLGCIALVLGFKSSANLAAAYGIAVTLTMLMTTTLASLLARVGWKKGLLATAGLTLPFLLPELAFLGSNIEKIGRGGWFPLVVGAVLFVVMTTWRRGRQVLADRFKEQLLPLQDFFELMRVDIPARVPGTAVFMTGARGGTPPALLHNFMHNRVVHQHILLLTVVTEDSARVPEEQRFTLETLEEGFVRIVAHYGFMEQPNVPELLVSSGLVTSIEHVTFFLGRENLVTTKNPGMARWRVELFSALTRNAQPATKFFGIPPDRVMEIGAQIEL